MVALRNFTVLALSAMALAFPTPTPTNETPALLKRTVSGIAAASCEQIQFTSSEVATAAAVAASRVAQGKAGQIGRSKYPHKFNNREATGFEFLSGCKAPFFEFPIFKSEVYTGGKPGADRVVIGSIKGADAAFCGIITHTGADRGSFLQCETA
ncbi:Guanyl-specific ribonuclease U1 Short=RNase U1 [Rhizoctonia solani AG-1 IB]|uniref:Guanyl-specific ribonuclease U1 Short=RNase U1 n=1 Tax=Thanatephorus cucumeris (strain AG1-IB / isolate 7/3/14) TaxID=1108050 RepID=M5BZ62_THACB|nr:Guanyl-specific ribonuclease U1 Short=RNase U1 [Rhizoctonia solani AG-1 IB]